MGETKQKRANSQRTKPNTPRKQTDPKPRKKAEPKPRQERAKPGPKPKRGGVKMVGLFVQIPEYLNAEFRQKLAEVNGTLQEFFEFKIKEFCQQ